ncbi:MAG: TetR/AcrR family transcriptional regulator [Nocardiaceae bacterium]|nr:TetR/AcrR family transcriptional regulator [Nocardiaceae bacterium]
MKSRAVHLGPERRRPLVLDTALEIASTEGIAKVTMGAIAERMGVTRPVVYDCFASRGEVLEALLARERGELLANVFGMLPPPKSGSVEQLFTDGFRALLTVVEARPASWRIIFGLDSDAALAEAISRGRQQISAQVGAVMMPLFKRWQVSNPEETGPVLVEVFLGICETAIRMFLAEGSEWTPEALAEVVGPASYRALRAR